MEVAACETRPLLQGSRLTAWELQRAGIAVRVITDGMAASLMRMGAVDVVPFIPIEGVKPEFIDVNPQIAAYRRMVRSVEFDVCEIAPSTYMIAREHGAPFKALPTCCLFAAS